MTWYFDFCALVVGLFFGSFFNVCIYRIPRGKSIVRPSSYCPKCQTPIRFYDNVPLLSFLLLRARCRRCQAPISARYPAVELLTGLLFLALALRFGPSWEFLRGVVFMGILIVVSFIDLDHQIIPDAISLPGATVGLLSSLLVPGDIVPALRGFVPALVGAAAGAAVIYLAGSLWKLATKREGMGGGDVKLAALMGAFLGDWRLTLLAIFLGVALGVIIGLALTVVRRRPARKPIPFGPFLAAGSLIAQFFGPAILAWYWGFFRH